MNHETTLPLDAYAAARALAYLATLALIGVCTYAILLPRWRDPLDDGDSLAARSLERVGTIALVAAIILVCAHLWRAAGQVRSFLEPFEALTFEAAKPVLFQTGWGRGWMAQLAAAVVTVPLALVLRRRPATGLGLLATAVLVVVGTTSLTGHAREHPWGAELGMGLHALHLLGGGVWLGTLFAVLAAGVRLVRAGSADHLALARMIAVFSPVALGGAAVAIVAGSLIAVAYVGDLASLVGTLYGRVLLFKLGLLALTMAVGAWNWRRLSPTLGQPRGTDALRRSATLEVALGFLLILATAVLVALPAPRI